MKLVKALTILFLLGVYQVASAQTATVTATVVDAQGCPYSNATYNFNLIDQNGNDITPGYIVYQGGIPFTVPNIQGTMDGFGKMTQVGVLLNNVLTSPQNTQWNIGVCSQNPAFFPGNNIPRMQCFHGGPYTITGNRDLSSELSALAPPLGCNGGGGSGVSSFRTQNLDPIFNSSPTSPTTGAVAQTFTLQNANPFDVLGNFSGIPAPWDKWQLVAGNNITITPDGTAKTVTLASSSPLTLTSTNPIKLNGANGPNTSGTVDIECPTCGTSTGVIDMQPSGLPAGTYALVYPTGATLRTDNTRGQALTDNRASVLGVPTTFTCSSVTWQGMGVCPNGTVLQNYYPSGFPPNTSSIRWTFTGALAGQAPWVHAGNITAIRAFTKQGWNGQNSVTLDCSVAMTIPQQTPITDQNVLLAGTNPDVIACTAADTVSGSYTFGNSVWNIALIGLAVYYTTDPAPPTDNAIVVAPPLTLINNTLGIDPTAFQKLNGSTVANLPTASSSKYQLYLIGDGTTATDCTTGGNSVFTPVLCYSNGTAWTALSTGGGGSGTVTSVATGTGLTGGPITTTGTVSCVDSTSSTKGCVQVDGTTITATAGVISAPGGGGGLSGQTTNYLPKATSATASTTSSALEDQSSALVYHGTGTAHGLTMPEGTPVSGVAASDVLTSDSTTHRWLQNPNNAGATVIPGTSTTAATSGNCVKYAANGYDIVDAGAACGAGGGGTVSGQANGVIPLATAPTTIGAQSHVDENTAGKTTVNQTLVVNDTAHASELVLTPNAHACATATSSFAICASDSLSSPTALQGPDAPGTGDQLLYTTTTAGVEKLKNVTLGSGLTFSSGTLSASATGGNFQNLCGSVTLTNATCSGGFISINASVASFTISAIPGTYTALHFTCEARGTNATTFVGMKTTFNSDTGTNYDNIFYQLNNGSVSAQTAYAGTGLGEWDIPAASATANYAGGGTMIIPSYAGTTFFKHGTSTNGLFESAANANVFLYRNDFWWRSTSAITSITETLSAGNFVTGSQCSLYGTN